ncbi:MAG: hypothetical protein HY099_05395 [Nitrospirae bacterium]|nr:hypothetical protein [Nitrospirota bacterium]
MYRSFLKTAFFVIAGIAIGVMFANFKVRDYHHTSLVIKKDAKTKPLHISDYNGAQVIALSVKNIHGAKDIELRLKDTEIQSWYPPVIKMPFGKWMEVDGGKFKGVEFGKRIPLYLIINGRSGCRELEIIDSSDGSLIQAVHLMRGGVNGGHH